MIGIIRAEIPAPDEDAEKCAVYEILALAWCGMYIANEDRARGMALESSTFGYFRSIVNDLLARGVIRPLQDFEELHLEGDLRNLTQMMPQYFEVL